MPQGDSISDNYITTYVSGKLSIRKAPLIVKADDKEKLYSRPNPQGTVSYTGFVNGDNENVLGGTLTFQFGNEVDGMLLETAGNTYDINVSGLTSNNYDVSYEKGILTVNPLPITVKEGAAKESSFTFTVNEVIEELQIGDIQVTCEGSPIAVSGIEASSNAKTHTIKGTF